MERHHLPDATASRYKAAVKRIGDALSNWQPPYSTHKASRSRSRNGLVALSAYPEPRRIRITESVLELGPVVCGICGKPFDAQASAPVLSS